MLDAAGGCIKEDQCDKSCPAGEYWTDCGNECTEHGWARFISSTIFNISITKYHYHQLINITDKIVSDIPKINFISDTIKAVFLETVFHISDKIVIFW